jgi:hypothetical protein
MSKTMARRETLACLLLFLVALLPRLLSLNAFITWDEPMWAYRTIRFMAALAEGRWGDTFVVGHPGVITMELGALGIALHRLLPGGPLFRYAGGYSTQTAADWAWLRDLPRLDPQDLEGLRRAAAFLPAAKLPLIIVMALAVVGLYLLTERLFDRRVALVAALLIALDPFYLAHSRLLHLDGLLTTFMTLSLLSLLVYLRRGRAQATLLFSGVMAGLAMLTKSPGLFLAPFAALLVFALGRSEPLRHLALDLLWWGAMAGLVALALWPALWADPLGTAQGVLSQATGYAAKPYETARFFLGQVQEDPGPWFYPVVLLFRSTPLTVIGLAAIIPFLLSRGTEEPPLLIALLAYVLLFGLFMTVGDKKFDRYLLPVFPALDIVAAAGVVKLVDKYISRQGVASASLVYLFPCFLVSLSTCLILPYHPYYLTYYNPLVGGPSYASRVLPVGWGEGLDRVARYLNDKEGAAELQVASGGMPGLGPLFVGWTVPPTPANLVAADYVVVYIGDVQGRSPVATAFHGQERPEHVVRLHGIEYAWIYCNTRYIAPLEYLGSHAQPGDAILLSTPSLLAKHYHGDLPLYILNGGDEEEIVGELRTLSAGRQRIWCVSYPDAESPAADLARYQLATHAYQVEEQAFPDTIITAYLLPKEPTFRATTLQPLSPPANFASQLSLQGYDLAEEDAQWGKALGVVLEWQAVQDMGGDYTAFVHLVDETGHLWGHEDRTLRDAAGQLTSAWAAGERGLQRHALSLSPGTPPGRYWLRVGLYRSDTGERLSLLDEKGAPAGTEYTLGPVQVTPSPLIPCLEELAIPISLMQDLAGGLKLLGYGLTTQTINPGQTLSLTLFWQASRRMEEDYRLQVQLRGGEGQLWAQSEFPLTSADYPTSHWREGEVVRGWYDLRVAADASGGEGQLLVELVDSAGQPLLAEPLSLARISVEAPERRFTVPADIQHPQRARLGQSVALLGYDLTPATVRPGETLHLTLYWQAQAEMETSYTVFTHLLDSQQRIWGQKDSLPLSGARPTTGWLPGEVIADEYVIPVQHDAPPGGYTIEVGMYDAATGARLPVHDAQGRPVPGDRVLLDTTVEVW